MTVRPTTVVFDIGNVLIAWDPRNLYRRFFKGREEDMEWFLSNVCTPAWNVEQDRGRSFADAVELLVKEHPPELHPMIRAFDTAKELSGKVMELAQSQRHAVAKTYEDLAERGEKLAKSIRRSAYTRRAIDQTKVARSQVKAAATSVRKAAGSTADRFAHWHLLSRGQAGEHRQRRGELRGGAGESLSGVG